MSAPAPQPYVGLEKWGDVAFDTGLATAGALLAWAVFTQVPAEAVAMRALAVYTAFAALATAGLAWRGP